MPVTEWSAIGLDERFRRLEKELRVWKIITLGVLVLCGLGVLCGSMLPENPPDFVVARQGFIVKDQNGRVRSFLGFTADGRIGLSHLDEKGNRRVELSINSDDKKLTEYGTYAYDERGPRLFEWFLKGKFSLICFDKHGIGRIGLSQEALTGDSGLGIRDKDNAVRAMLGQASNSNQDQMFGLSLFDQHGAENFRLFNVENKAPIMRLPQTRE